ncbi:sugar phosphate isomerase/epimerase family protein [Marinicrinis lubricantis]|uniref:Sugar phosphate isomerase/epimerase family protein n=1 Tax=Marinicrinis lubricantis TaxID=2086470 RepID=A0ABW1IVQ3_9BACL
MKVGVQLYTVRDELEKNFVGTLEKIAELGYLGVEFAGYGGLTSAEMKSELDRLGLVAAGSHVSLDRLLHDAEGEIRYIKEVGAKYISIPFVGDEWRNENWPKLFETIKEIAPAANAQGITLCYHNHDFELTQQTSGIPVLDAMMEAIDSSLLSLELDACWVHYAGYSPVSYIDKYSSRLPIVHFKDVKKQNEGPLTVELGQGEVDLKAIAQAARKTNAEWLLVEQDFCQKPSLESIANSIQWMKDNLSDMNLVYRA